MHQDCPRINNNSSVVVMTTRPKGCVVPQHRLPWTGVVINGKAMIK